MAEAPTETTAVARAYYRALDDGDYELLAELLHPEFVHDRPDRTLEGRDRFVAFMREGRPNSETTHAVDGIYVPNTAADTPEEAVVRGRLLDADGSVLFAFADWFAFDGTRPVRIETLTD